MQLLLAPIENVFSGQVSMEVWSAEGLCPAEAVLHTLARFVLEYFPSSLHDSHSVTLPPIDAVPARHSPQSVSEEGVQVLIKYLPEAQVAQVEHPAAPSVLVSLSPHTVQSSVPPVENLPAGQGSVPLRLGLGF